jgi:segregation and condensation protein B
MRGAKTTPAIQLGSVALRYAGAWTRLERASEQAWWGASGGIGKGREEENETGPGDQTTELARLEAVLFLAREPLSSRKLSQYANLADGTQARTLIRRLNAQYDALGRAFRVEQVAGGYQLLTRPKLAPWLRRLAHVPGEVRLSAPALETLAVVAYRQPVLRAEIEAIRGVNCGEILRQLMERDLIRISGRSQELGRPFLYATTKRFLQLFGLNTLEELPRAELRKDRAAEPLGATVSQAGPERRAEDAPPAHEAE